MSLRQAMSRTLMAHLTWCLLVTAFNQAGTAWGMYTMTAPREHLGVADRLKQDTELDPAQMIAQAGYPAQTHQVTTEDGYLLTVARIPPPANSSQLTGKGRPVLLQHGLLASAADWLIVGPGKALPFLLADLGWDVWLGNARGNTYSRAHMTLSPSQSQFWNFSFHEMGLYDMPAVTSFILEVSGHSQLSYVGHSMGTTMFFAFCASRPELQGRVRQMQALAPVAFMSRMASPLRNLAPIVWELQETLNLLGEYEFLRHGEVSSYLEEMFIKINHLGPQGAEYIFFSIVGFDPVEFDQTLLPIILGHTPAGASTHSVLHYLQEVKSGKFCQYDEGSESANRRRYGVPQPPEYNLSRITVPMSLHYSSNDWLANSEDVREFHSKLRNMANLYEVPLKTFNHVDFLWAKDVHTLVYERVIDLLNQD